MSSKRLLVVAAALAGILVSSASAATNVLKSTARTPGAGTRGTYTPTHGFGIVDAAAAVAAP